MQRLLLDTHTFVWCLSEVSKLAEGARAAIVDPRNEVFVSAITGWEIAVKRAKGRMTAPDNLLSMIGDRGFTHLPRTFHHAEQAGTECGARAPGSAACRRPVRRAPQAGVNNLHGGR